MVSPHNPHKDKSSLLGEYDRMHLVNLAIENNLNLVASNFEFKSEFPKRLTVIEVDNSLASICLTVKSVGISEVNWEFTSRSTLNPLVTCILYNVSSTNDEVSVLFIFIILKVGG